MPDHFLERRVQIRPKWAVYSLLLLFAVCLMAYSVHSNRVKALEDERAAREIAVAEAENQVKLLKQELALRGDDAYIARVAREKFGYMLEGEVRYMFQGTKAPAHVAPSMPVEFVPMQTEPPEAALSDPS